MLLLALTADYSQARPNTTTSAGGEFGFRQQLIYVGFSPGSCVTFGETLLSIIIEQIYMAYDHISPIRIFYAKEVFIEPTSFELKALGILLTTACLDLFLSSRTPDSLRKAGCGTI